MGILGYFGWKIVKTKGSCITDSAEKMEKILKPIFKTVKSIQEQFIHILLISIFKFYQNMSSCLFIYIW